MSHTRPVHELVPEGLFRQFSAECVSAAQMKGGNELDIERDLRSKIDQYYLEVFHRTQAETSKRWTFEQEIGRPYFHVTEIEPAHITNWNRYLDFEEAEGDYRRVVLLYERCLVPLALYDEFWLRYARYMYSQENKTEETRRIYDRAACHYTPIARPAIRMQWALMEEATGRADVAANIFESILDYSLPDDLSIITRLANLKNRQDGQDAAMAVYNEHFSKPYASAATRGGIVTGMAKLVYQSSRDAEQARQIYNNNCDVCIDSETFWTGWLSFEISLPAYPKHLAQVKAVHHQIRTLSRLPAENVKALSQQYMVFLTERGDKSAAMEYLDLDALVNGSSVVTSFMRARMAVGTEMAAAAKVNGNH